MEFLESRRSWENQKTPENPQNSGLFWASPFTMHLVWTLLILFMWKERQSAFSAFSPRAPWIAKYGKSDRPALSWPALGAMDKKCLGPCGMRGVPTLFSMVKSDSWTWKTATVLQWGGHWGDVTQNEEEQSCSTLGKMSHNIDLRGLVTLEVSFLGNGQGLFLISSEWSDIFPHVGCVAGFQGSKTLGHTPSTVGKFLKKFQKDPGNALRAFPGIPLESVAGDSSFSEMVPERASQSWSWNSQQYWGYSWKMQFMTSVWMGNLG